MSRGLSKNPFTFRRPEETDPVPPPGSRFYRGPDSSNSNASSGSRWVSGPEGENAWFNVPDSLPRRNETQSSWARSTERHYSPETRSNEVRPAPDFLNGFPVPVIEEVQSRSVYKRTATRNPDGSISATEESFYVPTLTEVSEGKVDLLNAQKEYMDRRGKREIQLRRVENDLIRDRLRHEEAMERERTRQLVAQEKIRNQEYHNFINERDKLNFERKKWLAEQEHQQRKEIAENMTQALLRSNEARRARKEAIAPTDENEFEYLLRQFDLTRDDIRGSGHRTTNISARAKLHKGTYLDSILIFGARDIQIYPQERVIIVDYIRGSPKRIYYGYREYETVVYYARFQNHNAFIIDIYGISNRKYKKNITTLDIDGNDINYDPVVKTSWCPRCEI